jgi:hypothetical protein
MLASQFARTRACSHKSPQSAGPVSCPSNSIPILDGRGCELSAIPCCGSHGTEGGGNDPACTPVGRSSCGRRRNRADGWPRDRRHDRREPELVARLLRPDPYPRCFRARLRKGYLMITGTASGPTLAELSDEERYERFDRLQERMLGVWEVMRQTRRTSPSLSFPPLAWTALTSEVAPCSRRTRSGCLFSCCF